MNNIGHISLEEKIVMEDKPDPEISGSTRPEQNSVLWIEHLVTRFSKLGQVVLDWCAQTYATVKACMRVIKNRRFSECEIYAACFDASMPSVVGAFTKQVLNEKSDIAESGREQGAAKIYLDEAKAILAKGVFWFAILCPSFLRQRRFSYTFRIFQTSLKTAVYSKFAVRFRYQEGQLDDGQGFI